MHMKFISRSKQVTELQERFLRTGELTARSGSSVKTSSRCGSSLAEKHRNTFHLRTSQFLTRILRATCVSELSSFFGSFRVVTRCICYMPLAGGL